MERLLIDANLKMIYCKAVMQEKSQLCKRKSNIFFFRVIVKNLEGVPHSDSCHSEDVT